MTHKHANPEQKCTEIGPNSCLRRIGMYGDSEKLAGFIEGHDRAWDKDWRCEGFVSVDPESPTHWGMTGSLEAGDLTLTPSLLCKACGNHGHVRDGKWMAVA